MLRGRDLLEGLAGNLRKRVANDLGETPVAAENQAFECGMNDADGGLFKSFPEAFLAVEVRHLHALALGDVFDEAFETAGLPIGPANPSAAQRDPEDRAVLSLVPAFEAQDCAVLLDQPHIFGA